MIKKMSLVRPALCAALLCGLGAVSALAQADPAAAKSGPGSPSPLTTQPPLSPPADAPEHRHGPPPSPLFDALDTNHDGIISAEEIANASTSLRALLKNGRDHLTREDLRPAGAPPPPPPSQPRANEEAGQPRPKIGAIRPHAPPPRPDEDGAPLAAPRPQPPTPGSANEADANPDRPPFRHERMSRHQEPPRPEDSDRSDEDARPPRPDSARRDEARPPHERRPENDDLRADGARPHRHPAPPSLLFDALDTNHDGVISADEIANASAVLKGLLKNGSDHLTRDDLRPAGGPPQGDR